MQNSSDSLYKNQVLVGFIFLLSTVYVDWSLGWNTVSRIAMPLSMILEGYLNIDAYATFTGDKATIFNHFYSDKAPLPGFIMMPVLFLFNLVYPLHELSISEQLKVALTLGGLVLGVIPFVWSFKHCVKSLKNQLEDRWIITAFFFGSFLFVFAGTAFSHALAGFLVLLSFSFYKRTRGLLAGICIGAAFCTEYTTAFFALFWGLGFLFQKNFKQMIWLILGSIPFLIFQGYYNYTLSGSALDFAYKFQENFKANAQNYGFGWPSLKALWHITLSPYRGMFFYAPVLLPLLFFQKSIFKWMYWKSDDGLAMFSVIGYILLFSMSKSWYGGWTFGPRYLYPAALLLFFVLLQNVELNRSKRYVLFVIGILGIVHTWLAKVIMPYPPSDKEFPLIDLFWPTLKQANFYPYNWLNASGLPDLMAPILLLLGILSLYFFQFLRSRRTV